MRRTVLAFTLIPILASAQPKPVLKDVEPADRALTQRAYTQFLAHCPGLKSLAPLISQINVWDQAFTLAPEATSRGWPISVAIEIKFRDSATHTASDLGVLLLNDYQYMVGSGKDPGIWAIPPDGAKLCIPQHPSDFISAPDVTFLMAWPSDADPAPSPSRRVHR